MVCCLTNEKDLFVYTMGNFPQQKPLFTKVSGAIRAATKTLEQEFEQFHTFMSTFLMPQLHGCLTVRSECSIGAQEPFLLLDMGVYSTCKGGGVTCFKQLLCFKDP